MSDFSDFEDENLSKEELEKRLIEACQDGRKNVVDVLLSQGVRVDCRAEEDRTPLILASMYGHEDVVASILDHGNGGTDVKDREGQTALMKASRFGHIKVIRVLLERGADVNDEDRVGRTALMLACIEGNEDVVRVLTEHRVTVDDVDGERKTALWYAFEHENKELMKALISAGADVDFTNADGLTVLMCASAYGDKEMIEFILGQNASMDRQCDNDGYTAVMFSVMTRNVDNLKTLLSAKPDLDLMDKAGWTVFSHALELDITDCLETLLEEGKLLEEGRLKSVHVEAETSRVSKQSLLLLLERGLFQWEWCPLNDFKRVSRTALEFGLSPGKIKYDDDISLSPLILCLLDDDEGLAEFFFESLYYFPEDYRTLCTDEDIRGRITNTDILDKITHQPLSLKTWSFLTVSKSISQSGLPGDRFQQVDALPIPDTLKRCLKFQ